MINNTDAVLKEFRKKFFLHAGYSENHAFLRKALEEQDKKYQLLNTQFKYLMAESMEVEKRLRLSEEEVKKVIKDYTYTAPSQLAKAIIALQGDK